MPQTTGLPAGPTSTHRTQPTNYNCKRNAPGARGSICRPRAPLCLPLGRGALYLPSELFVLHERPLSPSRCHLSLFPSTKTPILCSKRPKMVVSDPKSAQKPRFCARNARKRGSRSQKAHKNLDFVLEKPENEGSEGQKRTKTPILCSKRPKTGVPKAKSAQKPRFCARNAQKWGFQTPKKHKNLDFVLEKTGIGIGKSNRGLPANHRARFKNSNVS